MDHDTLQHHVFGAFHAAVDMDAVLVADHVSAIAGTEDPFDMYAACCGFAEIGKRAMLKLHGDREFDPARGDMVIVQELEPGALAASPDEAFAVRFFSAYCNDDKETPAVLFKTALDASFEEFVDSVCALLNNVAGIARLAIEQADQQAAEN